MQVQLLSAYRGSLHRSKVHGKPLQRDIRRDRLVRHDKRTDRQTPSPFRQNYLEKVGRDGDLAAFVVPEHFVLDDPLAVRPSSRHVQRPREYVDVVICPGQVTLRRHTEI